MTAFSTVLIGDESLLVRCGDILTERGHSIAAVVTANADLRRWAETAEIPVLEPGAGLAGRLSETLRSPFDWLLSIANLRLIPRGVLALPRRGAVNFHDGPLPRYAGLNAPVWALMAGETRHGVAWHMIEGGVDEGDILAEAAVEIAPDDTAFTLNAKCYAAGVDSFARLVAGLEGGAPHRSPQDLSQRSYFGAAARPEAAGLLDFRQAPERIARLVRALDHGPYRNPLCRAKIVAGGQVVLVGRAEPAAGSGAPGCVLAVDADALTVAADGGAVRLSDLATPEGAACGADGLASPGDDLTVPDGIRAAATERAAALAPAEAHWRARLADPRPVGAPLATGPAGGETAVLPLDLPEGTPPERLAAIIAAVALRSAGDMTGDIALAVGAPAEGPPLFADWVPLRFGDGGPVPFAAAEAAVAADLDTARTAPSYPRDLIAREPGLAAPACPAFGLRLDGDAPVPGCALTVIVPQAGAHCLSHDTAHLPDAAARLYAGRIETLARALAAEGAKARPFDELPILPDTERRDLLETRNATALAHDTDLRMHDHVARRTAEAPEATALIAGRDAMSFAALDARANRIAHVLRGMGVGPGIPVGLHCGRTHDLVAAALGILKAGGAYVPLDPAYPADRIAHYIADSTAPVIVTQDALAASLPESDAAILMLDTDPRLDAAPEAPVDGGAAPGDPAYLIYTSGSTGTPKGVVIEHRQLANFFAGMDAHVPHRAEDTWLAVTSLSFDIAVLELFYALSRGFRVVLSGDPADTPVANGPLPSARGMDFSLFYWGNDDGPGPQKYNLLLEGAKFADAHGFRAVWTPERHFHAFGGPYPNPAVTGAAVAAVTSNIDVRAGSCVAPLHHPARIAEDWAVIDNLTGGRAGIGFAAGWQPDDFVLRPENTPPDNKSAMFDTLGQVRRLWRGEAVAFPRKDGTPHEVVTQPRPVSRELPVWVTTAGNPDTWREAGAAGANVLTHLLGQSVDEVAGKIAIYHEALRGAGHDPADFTVTLMLHTYLAGDRDTAREVARDPMKDYLRSAAGLIKQYAWAFPAFKKPAGVDSPMQIDLGSLTEDELDGILDFAFQRYFDDSGLFGTVDDAVARVEALKRIGVDEIACLIDYGIAPAQVLEGLTPLAEVLRRTNAGGAPDESDQSLAAQILRHGVTHLQCTPPMARMLCLSDEARGALAGLRHILVGGEALTGNLVAELTRASGARILNMYGPTETTIWSAVQAASAEEGACPIGPPIANTAFYVLDRYGAPVPTGAPGELVIGGDGVARGYWRRDALTAERFPPDPFRGADRDAGRMYRTGDLVRWRADGTLDFLGRLDHQVKLRGYRIELGEIEARLAGCPGVQDAVVLARTDVPGDARLVGYVTAKDGAAPAEAALRDRLAAYLPDYMVPSRIVALPAFPLTPNRKIDRGALPPPADPVPADPVPAPAAAPDAGGAQAVIAQVFARVLNIGAVRAGDNFFALGGHSLLAVQAHRDLQEVFGKGRIAITDIFRFPTAAGLAAHLGMTEGAAAPPDAAPQPSAPTPASADTIAQRRALRRGRVREAG